MEEPKCGECGKAATNRCSRCKNQWYCSRDCQLRAWKGHKPLCDLIHINKEEDKKKDEEVKKEQKAKFQGESSKKKPLIEDITK